YSRAEKLTLASRFIDSRTGRVQCRIGRLRARDPLPRRMTMDDAAIDLHRAARDAAYSMPIEDIDPADPEIFRNATLWPYFERLRKEDPVHWSTSPEADVGGYWSVTRYNHIMAVDTNHQVFSSEPTIVLPDPAEDFTLPMFIAMDPPKHDVQRKTVQPIVAPNHLAYLEPSIRERAGKILDD